MFEDDQSGSQSGLSVSVFRRYYEDDECMIEYDDDELIIEIENRVECDGFCGEGTAFVTGKELIEFAAAMRSFDRGDQKEATLDAGLHDGSQSLHVRLFAYGLARHIAAEVSLSTINSFSPRDGSIARVEVEFRTESASLGRFARDIADLAVKGNGSAFLPALNH